MSTLIPESRTLSQTKLGSFIDEYTNRVVFNVYSARATRMELYIYNNPIGEEEKARYVMSKDPNSSIWSVDIAISELRNSGVENAIYYGYRAWGSNWNYDENWQKGSNAGFKEDCDWFGNRFNPNKLLIDPYTKEISHDAMTPLAQVDNLSGYYASGDEHRDKDSGRWAPKGIVLTQDKTNFGRKPTRPFKDEIIYEVHLRGLTMADQNIPEELRGTFRAAALKAPYLKNIGVTAVEFLPIHEFQNDHNDKTDNADGDFYWGYRSINYFAPDRRYAYDKSPGGPTREFKEMVKAFHDNGIKVYIDVVYNHSGEGGLWYGNHDQAKTANILSFRGLDNPTYYELAEDSRYYYDNTGVYGNLNCANRVVRNLIIDSLKYYSEEMGVDGFRFDLASVLGNTYERNGFYFDKFNPDNALNRAVRELPARPDDGGEGVDLIAEPWAIGNGTYLVGEFPHGWAEWNGSYRDIFRRSQNRHGIDYITPSILARRLAGSDDLYKDDGRKPWHSVNFIVAHDGFTLRDLYSYNQKNNIREAPCGTSDGGSDNNISWDHFQNPDMQKESARNGLAFLMCSAGVPMVTAGDEMYRTLCGHNNPYNLDIPVNYLHWDTIEENMHFYNYARKILNFRKEHPALRPSNFFTGVDNNENGLKDITWYMHNGYEADAKYMDNPNNHFIAYRIDGTEFNDTASSIYMAYNSSFNSIDLSLPWNLPGKRWYRVCDTASWMERDDNFRDQGLEDLISNNQYHMHDRSFLIFIER